MAMALFLANGLAIGAILVRDPALKAEHGFDDAIWGALGVVFAAAAIVSMRVAAPLIRRVGAPRVAGVAVVAVPVMVGALGFAPGTIPYGIVTLSLGAANGVLDVAMNATAVEAERRAGYPILSRCHGAWSIGATIGTLAGTASIAAGIATWTHLLAVALVGVPLGLLARAGVRSIPWSTQAESAGPRPAPWSAALLRLAAIGAVVMIAEGSALSWGGVLVHEVRGASLGIAAVATTVFAGAQTLTRLVGDRMRARWGDVRLFRASAALGVVGLALATASPLAAVNIVGFAVFGVGSATLVPIVYAETGRRDPGGSAVPRLTLFIYAGVLCGPAGIGAASGAIGLDWAIGGVTVLLAVAAGAFPRRVPSVAAARRAG